MPPSAKSDLHSSHFIQVKIEGTENVLLLNVSTLKGTNYNLHLGLLLGHLKKLTFRSQLIAWSSGRQNLPNNQEEGVKALSVKTEITQAACWLQYMYPPLL